MKLRGIEYGRVFCAPGSLGFFGEGYRYSHLLRRLLGDSWRGVTFAAKTTTLQQWVGNMPLRADGITLREWFPRSVCVYPFSGHVVNGVGLSGPGVRFLLAQHRWQQRTEPFVLSWAAVGATRAYREHEIASLTSLTRRYRSTFQAPFAVQLNCGCPNTGRADELSVAEIACWLQIASGLNVPLIVNLSVVTPVETLLRLAALPQCEALWIANTIPWGHPDIDWQRLFGSTISPLIRRGLAEPGGLSGPACLPFALERVRACKKARLTLPIIAGNGIQSVADAERVLATGADGIALGIVGLLRPWRLPRIVSCARGV